MHFVAIKRRLMRIDFLTKRQEVFFCHDARSTNSRIESFTVMVCVTRAGRHRLDIKQFVQHEVQVALVKKRSCQKKCLKVD